MEANLNKFEYSGECEKCHIEFNIRIPFKQQATQNFIFRCPICQIGFVDTTLQEEE